MSGADPNRIDIASRLIHASPQTIYEAFVHPESFVKWLPPRGMKGQIHAFNAHNDGEYHMSLAYVDANNMLPGKTKEGVDVFRGTFLELAPHDRIVFSVQFDAEEPQFAGEMKMTWLLNPVPEGTVVTVICENVPPGIRKEDHDAGLKSSLENLARLTE